MLQLWACEYIQTRFAGQILMKPLGVCYGFAPLPNLCGELALSNRMRLSTSGGNLAIISCAVIMFLLGLVSNVM